MWRPDLKVSVILGTGLRHLTPDGSYNMRTRLRYPCQVPLLSELKNMVPGSKLQAQSKNCYAVWLRFLLWLSELKVQLFLFFFV